MATGVISPARNWPYYLTPSRAHRRKPRRVQGDPFQKGNRQVPSPANLCRTEIPDPPKNQSLAKSPENSANEASNHDNLGLFALALQVQDDNDQNSQCHQETTGVGSRFVFIAVGKFRTAGHFRLPASFILPHQLSGTV